MAKALALFSGGLDSTLAVCLLLDQGVEIEGIHFISVFTAPRTSSGKRLAAKRAAQHLGIPLRVENDSRDFLELLRRPEHGYGSNANPCIDCRIRSLNRAAELMRECGAGFLVTGEVVGERPMSQNRQAMRLIEKRTGLAGLILRPLSAKLLEPTIAEKERWVDREGLLAISGRSRKPQLELAGKYGIGEFPAPAGGCLLTDPAFAIRVRDLLAHNPDCDLNDMHLLKVGRHFRLGSAVKAIIGRDKGENDIIRSFAREGDNLMAVATHPGPDTLVRGPAGEEELRIAAAITVRYSKAGALPQARVRVRKLGRTGKPNKTIIETPPAGEETLEHLRVRAGVTNTSATLTGREVSKRMFLRK